MGSQLNLTIAGFLKSPAVRISPIGPQEFHGVTDAPHDRGVPEIF